MTVLTLIHIRYDFWGAAFENGKACGVLRDGVYHPVTDIDWVISFCGGAI